MIRLLYNLLWPIGLLFFLPAYLRKMFRRGGYRKNFGQRFAFYRNDVRRRLSEQQPIWVHAVSVGEVAVALKLISAIHALRPQARFLLTTTTTTGFAFATDSASSHISVMYTPLDFWPIMHRAFRVIRPQKLVLLEAEVWPNMAAEAHNCGVPLILVNARLSARSERRFLRFRPFVAPTFQLLDMVCVQEATDAERWAALGVSADRIHHTGSIKYDSAHSAAPAEGRHIGAFHLRGLSHHDPVLLGGSTHQGEEQVLARVFLQLRPEFPTLTLIIAPRHVERVRQIQVNLTSLSLNVRLKSESPGDPNSRPDCILLDSTGELASWYRVATVVFVGKSLTAHGGQNPVEALVAGRPVIFGPHMENFASLSHQLVARNGAIQVEDEGALAEAVATLLRDPEQQNRLVHNAVEVLASHQGAARRAAELVLQL